MKKLLLVIVLLFGFLIITKQYHYNHFSIHPELNIPIDFSNHHIDVHNNCHEYYTPDNGSQNLIIVRLEKKSVYNINYHSFQKCFYIWQPPEFSC